MQMAIDILCWTVLGAICLFVLWLGYITLKALLAEGIDLEDEYLEEEYGADWGGGNTDE